MYVVSKSPDKQVVDRVQCPDCLDQGRDNLVVYADGHKHCYACGYRESNKSGITKNFRIPPNFVECQEIIKSPLIPQIVLKRFNIRQYLKPARLNTVDPTLTNKILYPYYDLTGKKIIGLKYRDFDIEYRTNYTKKAIFWEDNSDNLWFGLNLCKPSKDKSLIILEGESDTQAAYVYFYRHPVDCIGVSGAESLGQKLKQTAKWLRQYKSIYLCLDNDAAGKKATEAAAEILPLPSTYYVQLDQVKDFYQACEKDLDIMSFFEQASQVSDPTIVSGYELIKQYTYYTTSKDFSGFDTGYDGFNEMLGGGLVKGEVLGIFGNTGTGKSTFAINLVSNIIENTDEKVFWAGTEMQPAEVFHKFMEVDLSTNIKLDEEGKPVNVSQTDFDESKKYLANKIIFYNDIVDEFDGVEQAIEAAIYSHQVGIVVIDVLNDLDIRMNDWQKATDIMQRLNKLAQGSKEDRRPPVAMILIGHTIKTDGKEAHRLTKSNIRGGGAVSQKITCGIAINPHKGDLTQPYRHFEIIKKSRMRVSEKFQTVMKYSEKYRYYKEVSL